jgi:acetyltransferase-like isoleucine patch superfamily enzyme
LSRGGRMAAWLLSWGTGSYHAQAWFAQFAPGGFVARGARISHDALSMGTSAFVGDGVWVFQSSGGGPIELGDEVAIYGNCSLHTGEGGWIRIGPKTHIQPWCNISAYKNGIRIGARVEIAPGCAFYPYDHSTAGVGDIMGGPITSRGDIVVGDGAWLGHGVIVLDGVEIGPGAVIAAGSIVTRSIPANAIAVGAPAKVIRMRT